MFSLYFQNIINHCLQVYSKPGKQKRCTLKGMLQTTVYLTNMITLQSWAKHLEENRQIE